MAANQLDKLDAGLVVQTSTQRLFNFLIANASYKLRYVRPTPRRPRSPSQLLPDTIAKPR